MLRLSLIALLLLPMAVSGQNSSKKKKKAPPPHSWVSTMQSADYAAKLGLRHATFTSPSMGVEVGYYIYLPPGYEESKDRYPVVYHLHGGRPGAESKSTKLVTFIDDAIKAETVMPTIYVFPNGGPMSWYDMPDRENAMGETVFVKELIPHVDETYRTWGTREGRALEGYSQGGRGTTRIMFKHPEVFLSVAPGGSGYEPEKRIQDNDGYESENLRFLPIGYNAWDLAKVYAERGDAPPLNILVWDGTECFNFEYNQKYSTFLEGLGIDHESLWIEGVGHTAVGSYEKNAAEIMGHHQKTFLEHQKK